LSRQIIGPGVQNGGKMIFLLPLSLFFIFWKNTFEFKFLSLLIKKMKRKTE